jgi:hypothetical protein
VSWPPSPWVIVTAGVTASFLLVGLWIIACLAVDRAARRRALRDVEDRAADIIPLRPQTRDGMWLDEPLAPWPGSELDASIAARRLNHALIRKAPRR